MSTFTNLHSIIDNNPFYYLYLYIKLITHDIIRLRAFAYSDQGK